MEEYAWCASLIFVRFTKKKEKKTYIKYQLLRDDGCKILKNKKYIYIHIGLSFVKRGKTRFKRTFSVDDTAVTHCIKRNETKLTNRKCTKFS